MQQNLEILQKGLTSLIYLHKKIKSSNQNTEIAVLCPEGQSKLHKEATKQNLARLISCDFIFVAAD